jgi:hypothetical protein
MGSGYNRCTVLRTVGSAPLYDSNGTVVQLTIAVCCFLEALEFTATPPDNVFGAFLRHRSFDSKEFEIVIVSLDGNPRCRIQ